MNYATRTIPLLLLFSLGPGACQEPLARANDDPAIEDLAAVEEVGETDGSQHPGDLGGAACEIPPVDPPEGLGTLSSIDDIDVVGAAGELEMVLTVRFTTTSAMPGVLSLASHRDDGITVRFEVGSLRPLELFVPTHTIQTSLDDGAMPACGDNFGAVVLADEISAKELAELNALIVEVGAALPDQVGGLTFGSDPQASWCDTACGAVGAGAGAAAGVGAAGACTGASLGVGAPGCVAGGAALGAAAGVFVAAGCSGLFC